MNKRIILISLRLLFGTATLGAVLYLAARLSREGIFDPINYLSYFTNISNILAATILIFSALYLIRSRKPSHIDDVIRGAAVLYMVVTGVVYTLLLKDIEVGLLHYEWINLLLHYIMPLVVVADWLYRPQRTKLQLRDAWAWLLFPVWYLAYTLLRGVVTGWYPYPFLDPGQAGGYVGVAMYAFAILAGFCAVAWGIMHIGNRLKRNVA